MDISKLGADEGMIMRHRQTLVLTLGTAVALMALSAGTAAASGGLYAVIYDTAATVEKLVSVDATTGSLTAVGSGIGGWETTSLYIPEGENHSVFKVDLGVPGKVRVFP